MMRAACKLRRSRCRAQQGSALLVVLLMLGMIAALAAVVSRSVSGAAIELSTSQLTARLEWDLRAGIELGVATIKTLGERMRTADASVALADRRVYVRVTNERARIDLNTASPAVLSTLLIASGVIESDAAALAQTIVEWRGGSPSQQGAAATEDSRRYSGFARMAGAELRPNAELRKSAQSTIGTRFLFHPMQLASVPGFSKAIVAKLLPSVTVANGSGQVDPYIASRGVLVSLPGTSVATVDAFLSARDGISGNELALKLLGVDEKLVTSSAAAGWRIEITSEGQGRRTYRAEAVVAVVEGDTAPYRVLYVLDTP